MANYPYSMPFYGAQFNPQPVYNQQMFNNGPNTQSVQQQVSTDDRIWVANEQAADSYLIAPNSMVRLWDSNKNIFYEKRADATGRPLPIECYEYSKIEPNRPLESERVSVDYKTEINRLNERIIALEERMENSNEQSNANNKRTKTVHE